MVHAELLSLQVYFEASKRQNNASKTTFAYSCELISKRVPWELPVFLSMSAESLYLSVVSTYENSPRRQQYTKDLSLKTYGIKNGLFGGFNVKSLITAADTASSSLTGSLEKKLFIHARLYHNPIFMKKEKNATVA
jgi:hypothetical protein